MFKQRWMWMVWPAFLVAGLLEMLVFAFVDPHDLRWFGRDLELSRQAIYTLAFFAFWGLAMLSSALTLLLGLSPFEVNKDPGQADEDWADGVKASGSKSNRKNGAGRR